MRYDGVEIHVEHTDVLSVSADVLVLKYAQKLHGVDRVVVNRLGIRDAELPATDYSLSVEGEGAIAAGSVLFLGVPPLDLFDYAKIRRFGYNALELTRRFQPGARIIAMTVNGPSHGLDEVEAFTSQVAGILEAVRKEAIPGGLRQVIIADFDQRRVERLRDILRGLIPADRTIVSPETALSLGSVGFDAPGKLKAFVAMPFAEEFIDTFHFGIAAPVRAAGMLCERMDEAQFTGDVVAEMKARIDAARLVIADLTTNNANVYLEVGYAWGRGIPTVLVCRKSHPLLFDVRGHKFLKYQTIKDLAEQLSTALPARLTQTQSRDPATPINR